MNLTINNLLSITQLLNDYADCLKDLNANNPPKDSSEWAERFSTWNNVKDMINTLQVEIKNNEQISSERAAFEFLRTLPAPQPFERIKE